MKIIYSLYNYSLDNTYLNFGHSPSDIDKGCIVLWVYSLLGGYNESELDITNNMSTHYLEFTEIFESGRVLYYGRIDKCAKKASLMTANKCRSMSQSMIGLCNKRKDTALQEIRKRYGISDIKEFM